MSLTKSGKHVFVAISLIIGTLPLAYSVIAEYPPTVIASIQRQMDDRLATMSPEPSTVGKKRTDDSYFAETSKAAWQIWVTKSFVLTLPLLAAAACLVGWRFWWLPLIMAAGVYLGFHIYWSLAVSDGLWDYVKSIGMLFGELSHRSSYIAIFGLILNEVVIPFLYFGLFLLGVSHAINFNRSNKV